MSIDSDLYHFLNSLPHKEQIFYVLMHSYEHNLKKSKLITVKNSDMEEHSENNNLLMSQRSKNEMIQFYEKNIHYIVNNQCIATGDIQNSIYENRQIRNQKAEPSLSENLNNGNKAILISPISQDLLKCNPNNEIDIKNQRNYPKGFDDPSKTIKKLLSETLNKKSCDDPFEEKLGKWAPSDSDEEVSDENTTVCKLGRETLILHPCKKGDNDKNLSIIESMNKQSDNSDLSSSEE